MQMYSPIHMHMSGSSKSQAGWGDPLSTRAHPWGSKGLQQCSTVTPLEGQSMAPKHSHKAWARCRCKTQIPWAHVQGQEITPKTGRRGFRCTWQGARGQTTLHESQKCVCRCVCQHTGMETRPGCEEKHSISKWQSHPRTAWRAKRQQSTLALQFKCIQNQEHLSPGSHPHKKASQMKIASDHCENTAGHTMQERLSKVLVQLAKDLERSILFLILPWDSTTPQVQGSQNGF